jgi:hypothetical protein
VNLPLSRSIPRNQKQHTAQLWYLTAVFDLIHLDNQNLQLSSVHDARMDPVPILSSTIIWKSTNFKRSVTNLFQQLLNTSNAIFKQSVLVFRFRATSTGKTRALDDITVESCFATSCAWHPFVALLLTPPALGTTQTWFRIHPTSIDEDKFKIKRVITMDRELCRWKNKQKPLHSWLIPCSF